jgi:hypothetical protein
VPDITLIDEELRDAAQAARLAARQAERDAEAEQNMRMQRLFAADAERYWLLGEKFDRARRQ